MDASTLDWLADRILEALASGERADSAALQFLLRRYAATGRDELAEALGAGLARELDDQATGGCRVDCEGWLVLFAEASALSDDERLRAAGAALLPAIRREWSNPVVGVAMRAIDTALSSLHVAEERDVAAAGIDALERVVGAAYRPGEGVAHELHGTALVRGGLADHVQSASALLTAYMLAGRLPYAMLADELMQSVQRIAGVADATFALECQAARVFCRLAALHRDEEYRRTAVLPAGADYAESARRTLAALAAPARHLGAAGAPFGIALAEYLDLQ